MSSLISFSSATVLLGRGALSMFLTISAQERLLVVYPVLTEEDLLDWEEIDISSSDFGTVDFGNSRLNLRRFFLERTIVQSSPPVVTCGTTMLEVGVINPGTCFLVDILRIRW